MAFFEFLKAALFGVVEGITEWLPVSSTGHMILLNEFLPLDVSDQFYALFQVVIQLGAALAAVLLFWDKIWPFGARGGRNAAKSGGPSWLRMDTIILWLKVLVACVPAIIVGVLFDDALDALFYGPLCVSIMLILVGAAFIVVERLIAGRKPRIRSISKLDFKTAALIGLFQVIAAVFPGTSRSGATIIGALLLGVSRRVGVEFTFIMAIPVMAGASLLKIVKYGLPLEGAEIAMLMIGMIVAFAVSMLVIKKLLEYVRTHTFTGFGWYRIALGAFMLACFAIRGGL